MTFTTILKTGEGLLSIIYKGISDKFKKIISKPKEWFPVVNRYPLLMYGAIPIFIGLLFLLRYIIKFLASEIAEWASDYLGETLAISITEGSIMMVFVAVFIALRLLVMFIKHKNKKKDNDLITDES